MAWPDDGLLGQAICVLGALALTTPPLPAPDLELVNRAHIQPKRTLRLLPPEEAGNRRLPQRWRVSPHGNQHLLHATRARQSARSLGRGKSKDNRITSLVIHRSNSVWG